MPEEAIPKALKKQKIIRITLMGAVANIFLAVSKIIIGILFRSQALIADGAHSFSDLATDMAVLVGAHYWNVPADESHPYGHGRLETLINLSIALLLAVVACGIGWRALTTMTEPHVSPPGWPVLWVALLSIAVKEFLYRWTSSVGKRIRSTALVANAWHQRSDALSSVPVAVAVVGGHLFPELYYLDHVAALLVTAMLLKATWSIGWPAVRELMETRSGQELEANGIELAQKFPLIKEIHRIRSRRIGGETVLDLHMLVESGISVEEAHGTAEAFKRSLMEQEKNMIDVIVHIEPYHKPGRTDSSPQRQT